MLILSLASFSSVMITILYVLLALFVLLIMITIHEFGHYIIGKKLGFKINEFSIGFGKAIFKKTLKSGELFSIRIVPLGGYCAFAGEDEEDSDPKAFNNQKPWKRLLVQFGGVLFNFLSAIIFAFILLIGFGYDIRTVDSVSETHIQQMTALGKDTLQEGDIIRKVGDTEETAIKVSFIEGNMFNQLVQNYKVGDEFVFIVERNGELVTLNIIRNGEKMEVVVQKFAVMENGQEVGKFGLTTSYQKISFGQACLQAVPFSFEMAWECLVILGELLIGKYGLQDIGGPITTIGAMANASSISMLNYLLLIPLIAVNLAVFNLLPIPALDGAKMVFVLIEWIRGKPINRDLENKIHTVGLIILFGFVILVDLLHLFVY